MSGALAFGSGAGRSLGRRTGHGAAGVALETWRECLAYVTAVLVPVIGFVGDLGLAPCTALVGIGGLVFLARPRRPDPGAALLAALLVFALVSMVWTPVTQHALNFHRYKEVEGVIGLKLIFELALYGTFLETMRGLDPRASSRAGLVMAVGLALMAAVLFSESLDGAALYKTLRTAARQAVRPDIALRDAARGCYVGAVLFWPSVLRLRLARLPLAALALAIGLAVAGVVFRVDAPILALALSTAAYGFVLAGGRRAVACLGTGAVIYLAAAPLVAHLGTRLLPQHEDLAGVAKASWAERIDIWRFTAGEIVQDPLRGWGLDASRAWPQDIPVHPHNAGLQLWLELGAVGVTLCGVYMARLFGKIAACIEEDRPMAAACAATVVAYLVIGALSFGVWQEWWLALGAIAAAQCRFVQLARRLDREAGKGLAALQPIG